jgi:hypothetical protein
MVFTSRNSFAMQGQLAIILISWNIIFIWETGYWTRAMNRFALFDLLKWFTIDVQPSSLNLVLLWQLFYLFWVLSFPLEDCSEFGNLLPLFKCHLLLPTCKPKVMFFFHIQPDMTNKNTDYSPIIWT